MASKSSRNLLNDIRWWVLAPCLGAIIIGLVLLAFPIDEATKYFVSGALIGVGAGGGIAELSEALGRFEEHKKMRQLLAPALARCRLAYRIGEFSFPFYAAISRSENNDRHVTEMLALGEQLGIRSTLEAAISAAKADDPNLHGALLGVIENAMVFAGGQLDVFFRLGSDLLALRGEDAKRNRGARVVVASRVGDNLGRVVDYTDDASCAAAWSLFSTLWDRGVLEPAETDDLLLAFHAFFLVLGLEEEGSWKAVIGNLSRLNIGPGGRPAKLAPILQSIKSLVAGRSSTNGPLGAR